LPPGELLQAVRQVSGLRHCRAVDQDRNDRNIAFERRLDLDADEVARVVEAAPVLTVGARNPMLADDSQERVALSDAVGKDINKIEAGRNRVHVEKDVLASQPVRQTIDPPREAAGILSPIADEDAGQHVDVLAPRELARATEERKRLPSGNKSWLPAIRGLALASCP